MIFETLLVLFTSHVLTLITDNNDVVHKVILILCYHVMCVQVQLNSLKLQNEVIKMGSDIKRAHCKALGNLLPNCLMQYAVFFVTICVTVIKNPFLQFNRSAFNKIKCSLKRLLKL